MGDAIISLSTLTYLRRILPHTKIYYFTPEWTAPLFSKTQIDADKVIGIKMKNPLDWARTFSKLREHNIDAIFEMSQAGRTNKFFTAYSKLFKVPYVFHNHHTKEGPVLDQGVQKPIIQRDLDGAWTFFGKPENLPVPSYENFPPQIRLLSPDKKKRVLVGVVATRESKMYPLEKYQELAALIKSENPQFEVVAPVSNSPADREIARKLEQLGGDVQAVSLPLVDLPRFFKESLVYIGNDTGLKHLAVAVDIPSVTLFGPEPPVEWHPYDLKKHPYFSPLTTMISLEDFAPAEIWKSAKSLI